MRNGVAQFATRQAVRSAICIKSLTRVNLSGLAKDARDEQLTRGAVFFVFVNLTVVVVSKLVADVFVLIEKTNKFQIAVCMPATVCAVLLAVHELAFFDKSALLFDCKPAVFEAVAIGRAAHLKILTDGLAQNAREWLAGE